MKWLKRMWMVHFLPVNPLVPVSLRGRKGRGRFGTDPTHRVCIIVRWNSSRPFLKSAFQWQNAYCYRYCVRLFHPLWIRHIWNSPISERVGTCLAITVWRSRFSFHRRWNACCKTTINTVALKEVYERDDEAPDTNRDCRIEGVVVYDDHDGFWCWGEIEVQRS